MSDFTLTVRDSSGEQRFAAVASFVGADSSGSFGILAGHERFVTVLAVGLAKFRTADGPWRYLALPGGVLYFDRNELTLATRRSIVGDDYRAISGALEQELLAEERALVAIKSSLHQMEEQVLKRLWRLERRGP